MFCFAFGGAKWLSHMLVITIMNQTSYFKLGLFDTKLTDVTDSVKA